MNRARLRSALVVLGLFLLTTAADAQNLATADDLWANFETGQVLGLQAMHAGGVNDYVERTVNGVRCVATDGASGKHWLCFDVPRAFVTAAGPACYTLIIRYLDEPKDGLVTVRYHGANDPMAQAIRFQRQGSGEWCDMVLQLPDAVFLNGTQGVADFAVHGFTDTGDARAADVLTSAVWLSKRIVNVCVDPAAVPDGGAPETRVCRVVAAAYSQGSGPAPDGTKLTFTASSGTVEPEAVTRNGVATVRFTSGGKVGTAVISATWESVTGWATVATIKGAEPLRQGTWVGETFEEATAKEPERNNADTSFVDIAAEGAHDGAKCLVIHYAFKPGPPGQSYVTYPLNLEVPGRPSSIGIWVKGDAGGHHFQLLLQDASGTFYTVMPPGRALRPNWQHLSVPVETYDDCWGPNADGVVDYPITLVGARLVGMPGQALEGNIALDQITAEGLFPPAALPAVTAAPGAGAILYPVPREPIAWVVDNLKGIEDAQTLWNEANRLTAAPAGRNPEAIVAYQRLIELGETSVSNHWVLARLYYRGREFEKALAETDTVLKSPSLGYLGEDWVRIVRAWCLDGLNRRAEAAAEYAAAAKALEASIAPTPPAPPPGAAGQPPEIKAPVRNRRSIEMERAWCERGAKEALPFHKLVPNAGPDYREVPDAVSWTTSCSRGFERLAFATDRNPETFWSPNFVQKAGDFFALDLGKVIPDVARLVLDDDGGTNIHSGDLPGPMRIEASLDGRQWDQVATTQGDPFAVVDVAWDPRPTRYLRTTLTEAVTEGAYGNWRIYEAYVYRKVR